MKRKQGFTLVELLVVMAIIAILASIVVPNAVRYIRKSRATKALAETSSIEQAIVAMLADAERSSLNHLFNARGIQGFLGVGDFKAPNTDQFNAAIELYTDVTYGLLRQGRGILSDSRFDQYFVSDPNEPPVLKGELLKRLGTGYLDIGADPWGEDYRVFPGPWPGSRSKNPIVFRRFTVDTETSSRAVRRDECTITVGSGAWGSAIDGELDDLVAEHPSIVSYPADRNKVAFVWSYGENLLNSQMIYTATPYDNPPYDINDETTLFNTFPNQPAEYFGGGDDINNWDKGRSWERFYN